MNENAGRFRSALGGFHRQDVLNYIQSITQENQEQVQELTEKLEAAQAAQSAMEEELHTLRCDCSRAEIANGALEEELRRAKASNETLSQDLSQTQAQVKALRDRVAELEPGANSWQNIKSTAGDIEVTAHERAQLVIQEAQAKAAEIRADGIRWVLEIQDRCDKLQKDLGRSIQSAETELSAAHKAFSRTEEDMEGFQKALSELVSALSTEVGEEPVE